MYDRDWARRIVTQFRNVRTRTNNLDACIIEEILEVDPKPLFYTRFFLEKALIRSLQDKSRNKYWRAYQRLAKKTPLDMEALHQVRDYMLQEGEFACLEGLQAVFDFAKHLTDV